MGTFRESVSLVRSKHKLLSSDALITDRVIAAELRNNAKLLIKRDTDKRRLWSSDSIFTTVPCIELIEVSINECCEYISDKKIRRSKHKLPKLAEGNYSHILYVYNLDNSKRISEITPNRYINLLKIRPQSKEKYFWIENGYLYVTDEDISAVKIRAFFEDDDEIETTECDICPCSKFKNEDKCINPLDKEFKCPSYLVKAVQDMASEALINIYHKLREDSTSNEKED